jgi:hypothetical protein
MRSDRAAVAATAVVLVGAAVVSGPLLGFSLTSSEPAAPGTGSADVTVEDVPERGTLEAKNYGEGGYSLRGPPIQLSIEDVSGRPYFSYSLSVPGLNHSTTSLTVVEEAGRHRLTMRPSTIPADRIEADSYDGTIEIHVIDDGGQRRLGATEVTVEVRE